MDTLPYFIIGGVPRGGTTAVFEHLSRHPQVCSSSVKETIYFLDHCKDDVELDRQNYAKYFKPESGHTVKMEASPSYLYGEFTPQRIKATLGDPKLLFILRDPIDGVYSFYNYQRGRLEIPEGVTFEEYIDICMEKNPGDDLPFPKWFTRGVSRGNYGYYLKKYYDLFPSNNIKIMFYEDLKSDLSSFIIDICDFIGIDKKFYANYDFYPVNQAFSASNKIFHKMAMLVNTRFEPWLRKHPEMKRPLVNFYKKLNQKRSGYTPIPPEARNRLQEYYASDRKDLLDILKQQNNGKPVALPDSWLK